MLQMEFVTELFTIAKRYQVHTALDTSGAPFREEEEYLQKFQKLMDVTDLFILDMKEMDPVCNKELTGRDNQNILRLAKYLSERENRADEVAGKKATDKDHLLQQVLFDLVQTDTIKNSLTLGSHILKKIKPVHKLHSRNTEQAAFVVLKSPSVPSVLVETSFITNPEEERLLGTAAFRQKIATAIAEGVISYFHWFDNQKAHSKKR